MTRGEAAKVFSNLFKLTGKADLSEFTDVGLGKWYDDAIAKCVNAGIMNGCGNGIMDPEGFITREMFFVMFGRALGIKPVDEAEKDISDASNMANYAKGYIKALVNKGYIQGTDSTEDGIVVEPKLNIDRASVMSLMDQTIKTYVNTTEKVTAKDGLTLIVVDNANVTFANNTKDAEVYIFGKNTAITNAPAGTVVITSEDATGTKVNGKSLSKDATTVVEKTTPPGGGSYTPTPTPVTTYTVTFNMNGHGEQISSLTGLNSGSKITAPTAPTADGYTFDGWYNEAACTNAWNFSTDTVTKNVTLYAKWTPATIAGVLGTVEGEFPTSASQVPPSNAWVTGDNQTCFVNDGCLDFRCGEKISSISISNSVTKENDTYVYADTTSTITFIMDEGKLVSITFSDDTHAQCNGTYAPPIFKAVYNTNGDANTLTFYYDAADHSGEGITVYDNLPTAAKYPSDWGYGSASASVRGNVKKVVIDESVASYGGLTSTAYMFCEMEKAEDISGAEYLNISNVTTMKSMFNNYGGDADKLTVVPNVSDWDTSKVTDMVNMFQSYGEKSTSLDAVPDVSKWNTTNVTDMSYMFHKYGYTSTSLAAVPAVSEWNTSNVTSMSKMFQNYGYTSTSLAAVPNVSKWNTTNVTDMSNMFRNYGYTSTSLNFTLDLSKWSVAKVTSYDAMFSNAGEKTATWSVTIPAKTGETANTTEEWYVGDGNDDSKYIAPASGKSFTLATPTISNIADVLATVEGFPTSTSQDPPTNAWVHTWVDTNDNKCYVNSEMLTFYKDQGNFCGVPTSSSVTAGSGNNYRYQDSNVAITFVMDNGKLIRIELSGGQDYQDYAGHYTPPSPTPAATFTVQFDSNGGVGTMEAQTFTYGVAQNLKANTFTKNGCTFKGWGNSATGEVICADQEEVYYATGEDGAIITLYAKWEQSAPAPVAVTGINVSPSTLNGVEGTVTVIIQPDNASNKDFTVMIENQGSWSYEKNGNQVTFRCGGETGNKKATIRTADGGFTATVTLSAQQP